MPSPTKAGPARLSKSDSLWQLALLLLVFLLGCYDMGSGDIWWHLRTGQLIWERGETPQTDWFTYTDPGAEWINLHWGFQLAAAWLWAGGGASALILAKSFLGAATIAFCLTAARRDWPVWQSVACWLAPVLIFAGRFYVRPEIISLLLLGATLAILHHAEHRPRLLWLLPLVQLVWVNVQGLFVLQFVVLGCYGADLAVSRWRTGRDQPEAQKKPTLLSLAAATAATAAASFVNPYGARGVLFPLTLWKRLEGEGRQFYQRFSSEFLGFDQFTAEHGLTGVFTNMTTSLLCLLALLCLLSFGLLLTQQKFSVYRALLCLAFGYLAWRMSRNSVLFAIVGGYVFRFNVGELVEAARGANGEPAAAAKRLPALLTAVCLSLLIIAVPTGVYSLLRPARTPRTLRLGEAAWYAHDAVRFLDQPGFPSYVYGAHEGMAALCIYHLGPQRSVFADARLEVHSRETLERYLEIRKQLAASDPAAEENLSRDIPANADGRRPLPALIFDNRTLLYGSLETPGLLQGILRSGRWRCVYCDTKGEQGWREPALAFDGATVFLAEEQAAQLGLPPADISLLATIIQSLRSSPPPIEQQESEQSESDFSWDRPKGNMVAGSHGIR